MPFHVLINAQSGTARKLGPEKMQAMVEASGLDYADINILPPDELNDKMEGFLQDDDPVLVGGGDGTIARAAALHLKAGKPFGILPCGTMNLLAQDLKIPVDFESALQAYRDTKAISIDVGMVEDKPFLCCAAFGTMPEAAKLREEGRGLPNIVLLPRLTAYVFRRLDFTRRRHLRLTIDNKFKSIKTGMLVVSNNNYNACTPAEPFKKGDLQDGLLGIYTVTPKGLKEKIRLFISMKKGAWKDDPAVSEESARRIVLNTNRRKELISLDGEPQEMKMPLEFRVHPRALDVIVPAGG